MERSTARTPRWLDVSAAWSWRLLIVAAGLVVVAYVVARLRLVVIPILVALFVGAVLMPVVDRLHDWLPGPRTIATFLTLLLFVGLVAGVITFLVPRFVGQIGDLRGTVEQGIADVEDWVSDTFGLSLEQAADRVVGNIGGSGVSDRIVSSAVLVGEILAGLLLVLVLSFFVLRDGPRFARFLIGRIPQDRRDVWSRIGRRSWSVLGGYVRGVMITGVVDAVAIGIGLFVIGVPLIFSLMVLTFLGAFFPLIGAFLAGGVAVLVALVANGVTDALFTLALVIAVQQLEGDVVAPLVIGRSLSLHPLVIVLSLTAGAIVAGVAGAAFAVPLAAVVRGAFAELNGDDPG